MVAVGGSGTVGDANQTVRITTRSGRVDVVAEERADVLVGAGSQVRSDASPEVEIATSSDSVRVRCPVGTDVIIGTSSGRVRTEGLLGAVSVTTNSAAIEVDAAARCDLRSRSGRVSAGRITGPCRVQSSSGRVQVRAASGGVDAVTTSGRVDVWGAGGPVHISTVSGRVACGCEMPVDVAVETVSGRVSVEVPRGVQPEVAVSSAKSRPRVGVATGHDCCISVRSVSGGIEVASS